MASNHFLEASWWILDLTIHGISNISKSDNIRVSLILSFTFFGTLFSFKSGFIEVDILTHCDSLSRDEKLKKS